MIKNIIEQISIAILFLCFLFISIFGAQIAVDNKASVSNTLVKDEYSIISDIGTDTDAKADADFDAVMPFAMVTKVVDGDTINIRTKENTEDEIVEYKVRLIGINTPETVDPRKEVECFGKEASLVAREKLLNKKIKLELDSSQDKFDKYGRLLAYVYIDDLFFNKFMIEEGYAYEYTYEFSYFYQKEFKVAEQVAYDAKRGLWGISSSGGCQ